MNTTMIEADLSAVEARDKCRAIAAMLGPVAHVSATVSHGRYSGTEIVSVSVYPEDITGGRAAERFHGETWREALDKAASWANGRGAIIRENTIRKMALQIIDLSDQHGTCTAAMLRRQNFSPDQITELHEAACQRAGEMAQGAPFRVVMDDIKECK